ncbi:hypothetical protein [Vibrio anguillarum]|uniref:hypothetical protein n=1 Tax=Vibrio anguillarum TaxID=55601 RepID=UPI00097E26B7|nr:hypothetical protein [Vibrio anguillarum]EIC2299086.1 hypothetical protein [Vibrio cholerae]EJL6912684.1 hypothetical protein [Vibrio cholerae]MBT2916139.1 hypothetical protein [Vibrio anguillarum]OQQ02295.1 hypothetical protein BK410_17585 [Vibrio anguillarum]
MIKWFNNPTETIEALEKLGGYKVCFIFLFLCALISPGMLILFQYKREVFMSLESLKLLMLSISISIPIFLIGSVIGAAGSGKFSFLDAAFSGAALTLFLSYLALFFAYILESPFVQFLIILGALLTLGCFQVLIKNKKFQGSEEEA